MMVLSLRAKYLGDFNQLPTKGLRLDYFIHCSHIMFNYIIPYCTLYNGKQFLGLGVRGGSIIVGIIALIVIVAIIVFLIQVFAPVTISLIILAIIVGAGYWIYRRIKTA